MFFINDDHAQIFQWGKNRASCSDDDARCAVVDFMPLVMALAFGEMTMKNGDVVLHICKSRFEALHRLGSQCDLGNKYKSGSAMIDRLADRAKVDLCLA